MNPWKNLSGVASWTMRLALVLFIYTRFFGIFMQFNLSNYNFWFAAAFVVFGVLLLVGGFTKQGFTVLSGLMILILALLQIIPGYSGVSPTLATWLLVTAGGFYFLTHGNK